MTGDVLKRLREAYGLTRREVEKAAGLYANAMRQAEAVKIFWRSGEKGRQNLTRYQTWRKITAALRRLREKQREANKRAALTAEREPAKIKLLSIPRGATHMLGSEPLRIVQIHGRQMIFRHDGHDWVRSIPDDMQKVAALKRLKHYENA